MLNAGSRGATALVQREPPLLDQLEHDGRGHRLRHRCEREGRPGRHRVLRGHVAHARGAEPAAPVVPQDRDRHAGDAGASRAACRGGPGGPWRGCPPAARPTASGTVPGVGRTGVGTGEADDGGGADGEGAAVGATADGERGRDGVAAADADGVAAADADGVAATDADGLVAATSRAGSSGPAEERAQPDRAGEQRDRDDGRCPPACAPTRATRAAGPGTGRGSRPLGAFGMMVRRYAGPPEDTAGPPTQAPRPSPDDPRSHARRPQRPRPDPRGRPHGRRPRPVGQARPPRRARASSWWSCRRRCRPRRSTSRSSGSGSSASRS